MKKIMYSLFVFIFLTFISANFIKVKAASNNYYNYETLDNNEKVYYDALAYMYGLNLFQEGKSLDLIATNFVSDVIVNEYISGSNDIYINFEKAKEAFFLDYEDIFYVDVDKLGITIYQDESGEIFVELGSMMYESYLNIPSISVVDAIDEYNLIVNEVAKIASKFSTLEEKIAYVLEQETIDTNQKIKSVLDALNIENFIYHHIGSYINKEDMDDNLLGQEMLLNFYFNEDGFVEINSSVSFFELAHYNINVSRPVSNYNALENNRVQLLETLNEQNKNFKLVSYPVAEEIKLEEVYGYSVNQINFYEDDIFCLELDNSQMILLPFPSKFSYNSTNVEFGVKLYNEETASYEEIESVSTVLGMVCEVSISGKYLVEAREKNEESNSHEIVILVSDGGNSSVSKISKIESDKNLKITLTADQDNIVEKIAINNTYIKFKPESEFLYVVNYDEVRDGSFVIIDFINESKYNNKHLIVTREINSYNFEISGSHYAHIGGKPRFGVKGEFVGDAVYEWYYEDQLIERTTSPYFSFGPMKTENRGNYKVKIIITNGLSNTVYETENFKLYDSVLLDEDPFIYTVILCGILLLGFVAFAIFDNASFKQAQRKNR